MGFNLWGDKRRETFYKYKLFYPENKYFCKSENSEVTFNVPVGQSSHLDVSPPPAEGLGTDVGGHKVAVAHPPRSAEEVRQAVGHAGCSVAGSLLCCNAASGE